MACYGCNHCGKCVTLGSTLHEYCLACGTELENGLSACPNCGAPTPPPAGFSSWSDASDAAGSAGAASAPGAASAAVPASAVSAAG